MHFEQCWAWCLSVNNFRPSVSYFATQLLLTKSHVCSPDGNYGSDSNQKSFDGMTRAEMLPCASFVCTLISITVWLSLLWPYSHYPPISITTSRGSVRCLADPEKYIVQMLSLVLLGQSQVHLLRTLELSATCRYMKLHVHEARHAAKLQVQPRTS